MTAIKPIFIQKLEDISLSLPLKTYKMDFEKKRIEGFCEGEEALRQYIHKTLRTKRFAFIVYDAAYGSEVQRIQELGAGNPKLLASELEFAVSEAILENENIKELQDFSYFTKADNMYISFCAKTVFGDFNVEEVL